MAQKIVILGAGVAGAQALKHLHSKFHHNKEYSINVIDKNNFSAFIPMLHEVATGAVSPYDVCHPIRQIVHCCLETFHQTEIEGIDLDKKVIKTSVDDFEYDYLIIALGSTNNFFGIPGAEKYGRVLKTMADAVALRAHFIDVFEEASKKPHTAKRAKDLHFVVVGGGYTGVETTGQMLQLFGNEFQRLYPEIYPDEPKITLVQGGKRILPILSESSSRKAEARLKKLGAELKLGHYVKEVSATGLTLDNDEFVESKHVIWASGVAAVGSKFFPEHMLVKGRIKVKSTLQVMNHPEVFAIGDISAMVSEGGPHPQTAQAAFQQAQLAISNLHNLTQELPLNDFDYRHKGDLVPIGERWACAEVGPFKFTGFLAWWLRRTVYLQGIYSWSDRIKVVFTWTMNLFSRRDTTRL